MSASDAASDAASERDRLYFEKHPDAKSYVRRRYPGELGPGEDDMPLEKYPWVEVVQIAPGIRARLASSASELLRAS